MKLVIPLTTLFHFVLSQTPGGTKPDGTFQIKDYGSQLCLTLQQENFQSAWDYSQNQQNLFAVAEFQVCSESHSAQWFAYDLDTKQLSTHNGEKCLTVLPISYEFHPNLDLGPCDIWNGYPGMGSFLFSADCSGDIEGNRFNFINEAGTGDVIRSTCPHSFYLGFLADGKAVLTDFTGGFETATVAITSEPIETTTQMITTQELTTSEFESITLEPTTGESFTCEDLGCSHACFYENNLATCACPKGLDLVLDDFTCVENDVPVLGNSFISEDFTWRPIISNATQCVKKKFSGFTAGQQIFLAKSSRFNCFEIHFFFIEIFRAFSI